VDDYHALWVTGNRSTAFGFDTLPVVNDLEVSVCPLLQCETVVSMITLMSSAKQFHLCYVCENFDHMKLKTTATLLHLNHRPRHIWSSWQMVKEAIFLVLIILLTYLIQNSVLSIWIYYRSYDSQTSEVYLRCDVKCLCVVVITCLNFCWLVTLELESPAYCFDLQ